MPRPPSATGIIRNDDASLSIAATSADRAEGDAGATAYTFTVTERTGGTPSAPRASASAWRRARTVCDAIQASASVSRMPTPSTTIAGVCVTEASKLLVLLVSTVNDRP